MQYAPSALSVLLLVASLCLSAWIAWAGKKEFAKLSEVENRRRLPDLYKRWAIISFCAHFVSAAIGLALLGRLGAVVRFPPEFSTWALAGLMKAKPGDMGLLGLSDVALSLLSGLVLGLIFITIALVLRQRRAGAKPLPLLGDTESMLPSTPEARRWWLVVAANAGVSEELYYRLFLPLLFFPFVHDALAALLLSTAVFGLGHLYQGLRGVVATAFGGVIMSVIYLTTGNLFAVMAIHFLIDARAMILTPRVEPVSRG